MYTFGIISEKKKGVIKIFNYKHKITKLLLIFKKIVSFKNFNISVTKYYFFWNDIITYAPERVKLKTNS